MDASKSIIHSVEKEVHVYFGIEEVGSEARLANMETTVPLVQQRASYSTNVKVTWKVSAKT